MKIKPNNKNISIILAFCFFQKFSFAEEYSWRCIDEIFKSKFIESYIELESDTDTEDYEISEDDDLVIYIKDGKLDKITAINYEGQGFDLRLDLYNLLNDDLKNGLLKRKYNWNHINPKEYEYRTRGRNVFLLADNKNVRDYYWWIRNTLKINFGITNISLRPNKSPLAIIIKKGEEEIGFPTNLSNTSRVFLSTEPTRFFINLPAPIRSLSYGNPHPLEQTSGGGMSFDIGAVGGMLSYNRLGNLNYFDAYDPGNTVFNKLSGTFYYNSSTAIGEGLSPDFTKSINRKRNWIPKGTQRVTFGGVYSKLIYGKIDSLNNFTTLYSSDRKTSFSAFFGWTYVSTPNNFGSDSPYSKAKIDGRIFFGIGSGFKGSLSYVYSIRKNIALGFNFAFVQSQTFLKGQDNEFTWKPGYFISPNIIIRF